jgi:hemerythrin superfamily protein
MNPIESRRAVLGAAAVAALLPMQRALAQNTVASGEWLQMIKAHHLLISQTFDQILKASPAKKPPSALLDKLAYQLTAHSVAEENVIYPALAMAGMNAEADKLYLDQSHAKLLNAQIDMMAQMDATSGWQDRVRELQAAVLKHAKEDEEGQLYPQLQSRLKAQQHTMLAAQYNKQFESVRPVKVV